MTLACQTGTVPGPHYTIGEQPIPAVAGMAVVVCIVPPPPEAGRFLCKTPLRRLHRTLEARIEEESDLQAFRDRQDEPGIPWEQIKRELGL